MRCCPWHAVHLSCLFVPVCLHHQLKYTQHLAQITPELSLFTYDPKVLAEVHKSPGATHLFCLYLPMYLECQIRYRRHLALILSA